MIYSAAHMVCCGRSQAEIDRRAAAVGRSDGEGLVGTPGEIAEIIGKFAEIGAEHFYLQVLDLNDLDHLELLAAEVLPQV
jgi:alkanesulfonate monooxygenase SsuD/methylene tetrahydromethanopterin reductase-like flavin-dependent oxidoreductase (luciferase family)